MAIIRTQNAPNIQPSAPIKPEERKFYNIPDSTASNMILETLGAGRKIADLPSRKKSINRNTQLSVFEDGKKRQITLNNPNSEITIELSDIEKLEGSNKTSKKMFVLTLIKANEQAIHNGVLTKDYVSFPLQELINIGFYKTLQSARKGFKSGMDTLTSLKIKGFMQFGKKNNTDNYIDTLAVLFTGATIKSGQCTIFLNNRINWSFIAQYFTIIPLYYFKLPNRASDLLYYIFFLARQHTKDIEKRGYFTISFRAIHSKLQLPSEVDNKNPYRTIKQPIEEAIEQLEDEHKLQYNNSEFSLLPVYQDDDNINNYLNNGYLKVTLTGSFAKSFIEISQNTAQKIEDVKNKNAKIIEKSIESRIKKKNKIED